MKTSLYAKLFLLFTFLFAAKANAQNCSVGNQTFTTQAEINNFGTTYAGCTNITVATLIIGYTSGTDYSDITDLSPLSNIKTVTNSLRISKNDNLTSLDGLAVTKITGGALIFERNPKLTNIDGLSTLTSITGYFQININPKLTNLNGLSNLTTMNGSARVLDNNILTDISGLKNINPSGIGGADGLYIINNPQLAVCNLPNFCTYLAGSGKRTISGNKANCLTEAAVTAACASACTAVSGTNLIFNTQQDVDNFKTNYAHCTNISVNNLTIGYDAGSTDSDITNISALSNIKTVTGNIIIRRNPNLTTLNGLQNITSLSGYFRIERCDALTNITALAGITQAKYINIRDNAALTNLNGLHNLTQITGSGSGSGYLYLLNNAKLANVDALQNLTTIGNYIQVEQNPLLQNLNGLSAVTSINGNIVIRNNAVLENISGLKNIAASSILGTGSGLTIQDNPNLAVCNLPNFCTYLSGSGNRTISGNKTTCIDVPAVVATCSCPTGDRTFRTQAELDEFGALYGNCTDIILGNVVIGYGSGVDLSDIHDLSPLANVKTITGNLTIRRNPNLLSLNGFPALTSIGAYLRIADNAGLQQINGFPVLTSIGTSFDVSTNYKLEEINGFPVLTNIGTYLRIGDNAQLKTVIGFNNLNSVGTDVSHYLRFNDNPELTDISGFGSLTTVKGFFQIRNSPNLATVSAFGSLNNVWEFAIQNTKLANLDNFSSLTTLGGSKLAIEDNAQLADISGLANVNSATIGGGAGLYIANNHNLAVCNLPNFCTYLSGTGARTISGNKTTCLNEQAVNLACNPVVYIPDVNFKTYLLSVSDINTNGDIEIQVAEAEAFTGTINCNTKNIADLTGIEAFKNITALLCYSNNLTTLDVSKNTALRSLYAFDNQLTALDVSKNTALLYLSCYTNQLTALDVSKNIALVSLNCNNNQITALDVSKNTALVHLHCINNKLTSLNLKNGNNSIITNFDARSNATLSCIEVDNPSYSASASGWQKDAAASYNTDCRPIVHILDANFKTYLLGVAAINIDGDNEIQVAEAEAFTGTIDCQNKNIASLTGIQAFTKITKLYCNGNQLTSINVSQNTLLEDLRCQDNQISVLDVTKNTALTRLQCSNNLLDELDVSKNTLLRIFSCSGNKLTVLEVSKNTALTDLICSSNKLTALNVSQNLALAKLYCDANQITALDLHQNTVLNDMRLQNNKLASLNLKNGTNTIITAFNAKANSPLRCIQVDNPSYSASASGWQKDAAANYSTDCSATLANTEIGNSNIRIFPNPVKNILHLSVKADAEIYNLSGQKLNAYKELQQINLGHLPSGVYLIVLKDKNGKEILRSKIVKE